MTYKDYVVMQKRFWTKVDKENGPFIMETRCWIYTGGRDYDGYGLFKINRSTKKAHRLVYEQYNGPFDVNKFVCHNCDNPSCVNPKHLRLDTAKGNNNEAAYKGRYKAPNGDDHWTRRKKQTRNKFGQFSR